MIGHETMGEVVEVGDRVVVPFTFASYVPRGAEVVKVGPKGRGVLVTRRALRTR